MLKAFSLDELYNETLKLNSLIPLAVARSVSKTVDVQYIVPA